MRRPFQQQIFRRNTRYFILEWEVQLSIGGAFGRHPPSSVFACRQTPGGNTCTTVSGATVHARLECHPVRPLPTPPPNTVLPNRPATLAGPTADNNGNTMVTATSPINAMPNPEVIPILGPPTAAPIGPHNNAGLDSANWANTRNCARIEYTFYQPASLNFTDDDPRLEWTAVAVAGGAVSFLKSDGTVSATGLGRRVMVYGTAAGEVRFDIRFQGAIIATYRALVLNLRQVPCRCNILNGPNAATQPRVGPDDVKNHVDIANRFLRQLGIELTLDTDPSRRHGATATHIPGVFRIRVSAWRTRNVNNTDWCTRRNYRANVMNFAYIHSDRAGNLGAATDFPANNAGATITDPPTGRAGTTATPSTSWIRPTGTGVGTDATTGTITMNLIAARQRASDPQLFAMYVTDANGGTGAPNIFQTVVRQREYANTMSHEFGHILNLGHRVEGVPASGANPARDMTAADPLASLNAGGIFWDGLLHPPHENVMQWWDPSTIAQDFDLIQARAVQQSPLVVAATIVNPAA